MPVPYDSMLHIPPTNLLPPAARREPYKKKSISFEVFWKTIVRKMGQQAEKKIRQKG